MFGLTRLLAGAAEAVTDVVREFSGGGPSRRTWCGVGRYWIEVRGLPASGDVVLAAVRKLPGVLSAELNHPLERVIVQVAAEGPSPEAVTAAVDAADGDPKEKAPIDLPGDGIALAGALTAATLNAAGFGVAVAGRVLPWPRLPTALTAAVTLIDYQPRLRHLVEERFGTAAADTALALATAVAYTLAQAPASLAVDVLVHLAKTVESRAAGQVWERREPTLSAACPPMSRHDRPRPMPPGPIERHGDRSALAQSVATPTLGLLTGSLESAATAAVVAAPKAARNCREAFAATLCRGLADHHGVLPLDRTAFRRLDRIDTVLIDPRVLRGRELRVSGIRGVPDEQRAAVWDWAHGQLDRDALGPGWHSAGAFTAGEVHIRPANHPLAGAVVAAVRTGGAEALSLDVDQLGDLRPAFDELLDPTDSPDRALADAVAELQADGRTVAVVSSVAAQALYDADVSIGVLADDTVPWCAELLAEDLGGVWQVLQAIPAARRASRRGVELATGASLLGALLMVPGVRGRGPGPVTAGAAAGFFSGYRLARSTLAAPPPVSAPTREWHAMPADRVLRLLTESPAEPTATGPPPRRLVGDLAAAMREELGDPLTPVLAIGAAASAVLGSPVDAILVGSVLTGNAALAATQRVRSERLLRKLLAVQDPAARRVGEDGYETVPAAGLRPGEVIEVRPGEVLPADIRLTEAPDLEIDESALTGESLPVAKQITATPTAPLAERSCMAYAATTVVAGRAVGIVTAVGAQTQARRAADAPATDGPAVGLQSQLSELTHRALPVSLAGGALVGGLGLLRMAGLRRAVSSAVAVSVAAVPEGLPLVATLAQQASARRLTRLGALVRAPRSVEALGRVDVVCFDKTGTLSLNRLRVAEVRGVDDRSRDMVLSVAGRATPPANGNRHEHATDVAIVEAAGGSATMPEHGAYLPFRSGRPFSASLTGDELCIKGAPEVILPACADAGPDLELAVGEMAARGLRVIAVARHSLPTHRARRALDDDGIFAAACREDLELAGFIGLSDTARPESAQLLAALAGQDIAVRLITGDHPVTAAAIATELGLAVSSRQVLTGAEWEALSRRGQERAVAQRVVFARMSPEQKVQIVETLQRTGRVCAMVGDGANDAAAIRAAAVGIGVASAGSDPARTAADVMLLDGRIIALLDALDEGRQLWRRVQAAVSVLLGGNAGEVAFAVAGTAVTGRSPLNTRQLLLVNLLTDALPAAALAVSPPTTQLRGAGRGPDQAALWRTVAIRGGTTAAGAMAAWVWAGLTGRPRRAATVALVALVSTQLGQTLLDSRSPLVLGTAIGSLVVLGALISIPGISQLLGSTPLGPVGWTQALTAAALATVAAALVGRLFGQSSMSMTPARHSTAYNSRNGTASARATTSVNGSVPMAATLSAVGVETSNSP